MAPVDFAAPAEKAQARETVGGAGHGDPGSLAAGDILGGGAGGVLGRVRRSAGTAARAGTGPVAVAESGAVLCGHGGVRAAGGMGRGPGEAVLDWALPALARAGVGQLLRAELDGATGGARHSMVADGGHGFPGDGAARAGGADWPAGAYPSRRGPGAWRMGPAGDRRRCDHRAGSPSGAGGTGRRRHSGAARPSGKRLHAGDARGCGRRCADGGWRAVDGALVAAAGRADSRGRAMGRNSGEAGRVHAANAGNCAGVFRRIFSSAARRADGAGALRVRRRCRR